MLFGGVFERFLKDSPLSVMSRATIEHALSASALDALFDRTAERGYTRELLFSTTVELMTLVVGGKALHVQAAYQHLRDRVPVTLKCVYDELRNIEIGVSAGLVSHVSGRCEGLIAALGGACKSLLPGYRVRILDGNHLAATQRRLGVTRGHTAGPRPGQSLVVLDPALMPVTDVVPCEDAHTQERALIDQISPLVRARDVWVADRNFCAVLKAALRAVHGERKVQEDVSGYYMAREWAMVYAGMMIAMPASEWEAFGPMPSRELAGHLREWAGKINLDRIKKAPPRKPTRTATRRIKDKSPHVSTARLLDAAEKTRQARASRNP